jgi:cardiolipin synthase A/B
MRQLRRDADDDALAHAMNRAAGARAIGGNVVRYHSHSPAALEAMIGMIGRARRWVHLENYIIRDDRTGGRFADALAERVASGVRVRVLDDALGCRGTSGRYWRRLRRAGVDVRCFHPLAAGPIALFSRNHRKLLEVDGLLAMVGGLCIGDEWAGDPAHGRQPWRDTMAEVEGPAVASLGRTFARAWAAANGGASLPDVELEADPAPRGQAAIRIVEGIPGRARMYRAAQLMYAAAAERLWITDAYLLAPPPLFEALQDAAREGVDVRLLLPGTSDLPVVRDLTRIGYRDLLHSGARLYEWTGPMLHAKSVVVDRRWARVGSTNLNVQGLLANYELDLIAESGELCDELAHQFRRDLAQSREIVLHPRRFVRRPRLGPAAEAAPGALESGTHRRTLYERQLHAAVSLRRVAGGLRHRYAVSSAVTLAAFGAAVLFLPQTTSVVVALGAFGLAAGLVLWVLRRRRSDPESESGEDIP